MNTKSLAVLAGVAALFSGSAMAETPNYNYVELSGSWGDVEGNPLPGSNIDIDGYEIEGSVVVNNLLLQASVSGLEEDVSGADLEIDAFALSIGAIKEIGDNTAFDISFQYRDDEATLETLGELEIDGPAMQMGLRSNVSDSVEVYGRIGYLLGSYEGGTSLDLGAAWSLSDSFAATLSYEVTDFDDSDTEYQLDQWQLGGRWNFK